MNLSRFLAPVFAAAVLLATPGCPAAAPQTTVEDVQVELEQVEALVEMYDTIRRLNAEMGVGLPNPNERLAAVQIDFVKGQCSGYAVGPHLFVTAAHCFNEESGAVETINAIGREPEPAAVIAKVAGETDHVFVVTDYTFEHYARSVRLAPALPRQGERLHYWGAPLGVPDQYREGYVTGYCDMEMCFPGLAEFMGWPLDTQTALMDIAGQKGDSGAGLLNEAGDLIGIVSLVQHMFPPPFVPMAAITFSFTDEQLAELEAVSGWRP